MEVNKHLDWQTLLEGITLNVSQDVLHKINCAHELRNKIEICLNTPSINSALKEWLSHCISKPTGLKNKDFSFKSRETGNAFFKKKKHFSALQFYNKALFYAPKDSEELKSAYSNRSFVLFTMRQFEESIRDIDRALDTDNFSERNANLLIRKIECYLALKKPSEAQKVTINLLSKVNALPAPVQQKINQSLKDIRGRCKCAEPLQVDSKKDLEFPSVEFHESPHFRFASKSLDLAKSEDKGRYVIANEEIKVGDVLFLEKPFSFVILPDMIDKYCSYCCKRIFTPVPCASCPLVCFCNESCRDSAFESFHRWECGGLEVCYSIGIVHLSLRVGLLGLQAENLDRYTEVKNLVSHLNDLQPPDLFSYAVTATLLTMYLENYTNLFESESRKDKLLDFGGAMLLHIGQLVCNGHAITDMESLESECDSSLLIEDQVRIATAIYPSASMMNHSCDPNIVNCFFNSLLIVRATQNLNCGEEIFNCYGPLVQNTNYKNRQKLLLSQYFFVCDCPSCINMDGPKSDTFLCQSCFHEIDLLSSSCCNCSAVVNAEKLLNDLNNADSAFKEGLAQLENGKFKKAIDLLLKALKIRETNCHPNHKKLLECRDSIAKAYVLLGQEEEAFSFLEKNIESIENMYGNLGIVLGQEIMKILSIATSMRDKNDSLSPKQSAILKKSIKYGDQGLLIFKLSYGEWHPRFQEMAKHFKYLQFCSESIGETAT